MSTWPQKGSNGGPQDPFGAEGGGQRRVAAAEKEASPRQRCPGIANVPAWLTLGRGGGAVAATLAALEAVAAECRTREEVTATLAAEAAAEAAAEVSISGEKSI